MYAPRFRLLLGFLFFSEGSAAAALGTKLNANPYERGSPQHEQWDAGWMSVQGEQASQRLGSAAICQ